MEKKKNGLLKGAIDILIFAYTVSIFILSFDEDLNKYSRLLALVLMGLLAVYALANMSIKINSVVLCFMGFTAFGYLSYFWALDQAATSRMCFTLLQLFVLFWLLYNYLSQEQKLQMLVDQMCWAGAIFSVYIFIKNRSVGFGNILAEGGRVTVGDTNENMLGFIVGCAALLSVWNILYRRKFIYIISMLLCFVTLLGSGSRTALIVFICGVILMSILKGNGVKKLLMLAVVVCVMFVIYMILQLPYFEVFMGRIEAMINGLTGQGAVDNSTKIRLDMITSGIDTFLNNPILGIGLNSSGVVTAEYIGRVTYLHNNYVELLACVGFIGTAVFYAMYFIPLRKLIKPAIKIDPWAILGVTVLITNLVSQIGTVTYYSKIDYLQILVFTLAVEAMRGKYEKNKEGIKKS